MVNYWMAVGTQENWRESFEKGSIWGLKERQKHLWNTLSENDIVLFYVIGPVAGIVGYGSVKTKFRQTQPLWSEEVDKNKVIWPLRFEFSAEHCLAIDKWQKDRVAHELLKFKAGLGFQHIDSSIAQEIISKFKEKYAAISEEPTSHKEIKQNLIEIGRLQGYIAEPEYPFDLGRLDVVWRRIEKAVPTYVFEVNVKGDFYHDISKLKHAYDLWNSRIFIVASDSEKIKINNLLSGTFHEIADHLKFIDSENIKELYKLKKHLIELEKKMGI